MIVQVADRSYEFMIASEVGERDGIGVEVYQRNGGSRGPLLCEVFRDDQLREVTFTAFDQRIPVEVVEHACRMARERLADWLWPED